MDLKGDDRKERYKEGELTRDLCDWMEFKEVVCLKTLGSFRIVYDKEDVPYEKGPRRILTKEQEVDFTVD